VCDCQPPYYRHRLPERGFHDSIPHAYYQQQEKREGIPECVEDGYDNHKYFRADVIPVSVLVVVEAPCHEHFDDQKYDDRRDVVLNGQDIVPVLHIQECPECTDDRIYNCETTVKREFSDLSSR